VLSKLQTRPLVREVTPKDEQSSCVAKERKKKSPVMGGGVPDTKTDRPTNCRSQNQLNSVKAFAPLQLIN
jgi:hypothetical protein